MTTNRKILIISILVIGLFIIGIVGLTYAFFTANVIGNDDATPTVIETADLRLLFDDTQILTLENALPGASATKIFTVTNVGNVKLYYDINVIDVINTFSNNELVYSLTSTNDGAIVTNMSLPTTNGDLITDIEINPGITQTYTMTVKFIETGTNQNTNQGAEFSGKLQINAARLISENVEFEIEDTVGDVIINQSRSINLTGAYYGNVTCESANESIAECTASKNKIDIIGKSTGTTEITVRESIKNLEVTYTVTVKEPTFYDTLLLNYTPQSDSNIDFTKTSSQGGETGLYYTEDATTFGEDGERIYYFRGMVNNNWVSFGGYLWRIVRTNSEGGIKLVYSGNGETTMSGFINSSIFNSGVSNKYYGGYTYNTDLNGYTGDQTDSAIKIVVDNWYDINLDSYSNYLSQTAVHCADRSSEVIDGTFIYYPSHDRLWTTQRPTYACPSANASRYTVSTSTGNGYLQKPIALLSIDEMYYAGNLVNQNTTTYLSDNVSDIWWSMTPLYFSKGTMRISTLIGQIGYYLTDAINGVRPAVYLKSCVKVINGDGTKLNPYTITNEDC